MICIFNVSILKKTRIKITIPEASRRVLNVQRKELEEHEFVTKVICPVAPPKVEYSLTELRETLIPVIFSLGIWGDEHQDRLTKVILK